MRHLEGGLDRDISKCVKEVWMVERVGYDCKWSVRTVKGVTVL